MHVNSQAECAEILALKIGELFQQDKKILWLLSGGSNISISVGTLKILESKFPLGFNDKLTVTLTDERYGLVGHRDSNWQQLIDAGFDFSIVQAIPVLNNLSLAETAISFSKKYRDLINSADFIIGQFGIGADGHIAGVLPQTVGVTAKGTVCNYQAEKFMRISLTLDTIRKINIAYAFVFADSKREMLQSLKNRSIDLADMPAQVLKQVPESYLCSDIPEDIKEE